MPPSRQGQDNALTMPHAYAVAIRAHRRVVIYLMTALLRGKREINAGTYDENFGSFGIEAKFIAAAQKRIARCMRDADGGVNSLFSLSRVGHLLRARPLVRITDLLPCDTCVRLFFDFSNLR